MCVGGRDVLCVNGWGWGGGGGETGKGDKIYFHCESPCP